MKSILIAVFVALAVTSIAICKEFPSLKASEAVALAEKDLEDRGMGDTVFPTSISFKGSGAVRKDSYWEVLWSKTFPSSQMDGYKEIGAKIRMDGSVQHIVKK